MRVRAAVAWAAAWLVIGCAGCTASPAHPDGRYLLVGNYASGQLEAVSVPSLP